MFRSGHRRGSSRHTPYGLRNDKPILTRHDPHAIKPRKPPPKNSEVTSSHKIAYQASKAAYGDKAAIEKLKSLGYFVDPENSNDLATTFFSATGKPIVAFRGTRDFADIRADTTVLTGKYNDPAFKNADALFQKVKLKYAARGIPIATGHSLGGTKAALAGGKHGGEVVVFNPGTGAYKLVVKGHVYRTDNDIISKRVDADSESVSPGGHSLANFDHLE